ncbi:hypothetical protein [Chryseobacterium timonianum]|uniref:hypothetical protein n=1 Tax=Chryseobacterium timonianum TaxID=1805473 RepID=UPI00083AE580|nr:hypothetical protein [Chryseobacterium timonianum]
MKVNFLFTLGIILILTLLKDQYYFLDYRQIIAILTAITLLILLIQLVIPLISRVIDNKRFYNKFLVLFFMKRIGILFLSLVPIILTFILANNYLIDFNSGYLFFILSSIFCLGVFGYIVLETIIFYRKKRHRLFLINIYLIFYVLLTCFCFDV